MGKPTYYLWRNDYPTQETFEQAKEKYRKLRFRVVTYLDGQDEKNIHDGLKAIIKNHIND